MGNLQSTAAMVKPPTGQNYTFSDGYVGPYSPTQQLAADVSYNPWLLRIFDDIYAAILLELLCRWDREFDQDKPYYYEDKVLLAMLGWKQEHLEHAIRVLSEKGVLWCRQGKQEGQRLYWPHGREIDKLADARLALEKRESGHGT